MQTRPHVVIVGGGFGGLNAAKALAGRPVDVTLVDRENYHLFQPLLYQVATAGLSPGDIAEPIRAILRRYPNVRVLLGEVAGIDPDGRTIRLMAPAGYPQRIGYDFLILATGSRHAYFGHDEWEQAAPGLKSLDDALEVRRRVLAAFEAAEREEDPARQRALLTFVVVGGGPTGVELAGALAEIGRHTIARDFRRIDPRSSRVLLLEGGPRVLPTFPASLSARAEESLRRLGVEVRTGAMVAAVDAEGVRVGDEPIAAATVLWAAGNRASSLGGQLGAPLDRAGRVQVEPDLTVPGHPEIYVVGDLAALPSVPGVAPAAMQMGRAAAANVWRTIRGEARRPFAYVNKGNLATIGRNAAVADLGWLRFWGLPAWLLWGGLHIFYLIGFHHRVVVLIQWLWAYLTHRRGARLITRPWQAGATTTAVEPSKPKAA
ncbi:MAG TPA: NAD(P)/FAD-dependent oxidoreductase [Chloroflexota bacterium]|jgi:NADH dehydrogenase